MIVTICCILALILISRNIEKPDVGPKFPFALPPLLPSISIPTFIAAMCAGHILGFLVKFTLGASLPG